MPTGVHADRRRPGRRIFQALPLGSLWLGSLSLALCSSCTPSAGSPIEFGPGVEVGADAGAVCLPRDYPILFQAFAVSSELESQLYVMRADGSEATRIARGSIFYERAAWAPDGFSIAFRRRALTTAPVDLPTEIGVMAGDGTEQVTLFADRAPPISNTSFGPTWAPDGASIAFSSRRDSGQWAIWVLSRFGGTPRLLMPDLEAPQWSPSWSRGDPTQLAYVAALDGVEDIWRVDVTEPTLRENLTRGRALSPWGVSWSPDGHQLAFVAEDPMPLELGGGDPEVYVWTDSTSDIVQVTDNDANDVNPVWSPDGKSLLLSSDRLQGGGSGGPLLLWLVALDGPEPARVLSGRWGQNPGADWYWSSSCGSSP